MRVRREKFSSFGGGDGGGGYVYFRRSIFFYCVYLDLLSFLIIFIQRKLIKVLTLVRYVKVLLSLGLISDSIF